MPNPDYITNVIDNLMEPTIQSGQQGQRSLVSSLHANNVPTPVVEGIDNLLSMVMPVNSLDMLLAGIPAFHGTGKMFKKFDPKFIGQGEGFEAFGHGLYFAENRGVANSYKPLSMRNLEFVEEPKNLSSKQWKAFEDLQGLGEEVQRGGNGITNPNRLIDRAIKEEHEATKFKLSAPALSDEMIKTEKAILQENIDALEGLRGKLTFEKPSPGNLMEVDIDIEFDDMLDWDKPLNKQSPKVQEALRKFSDQIPVLEQFYKGQFKEGPTGEEIYRLISQEVNPPPGSVTSLGRHIRGTPRTLSGRVSTHGNPEASRKLSETGIPGIRYLDEASRVKGKGTRNFVVFPDAADRIKIHRVNDLPLEEALKQFPEPNLINQGS